MIKKIHILFLLLAVAGLSLKAQQYPLTDQYLFNPVAISPAFTGKDVLVRAFLTHRSEWVKVDGSPVNGFITADGTIAPNMGLGLNVNLSKAGIYKLFSFSLAYAYHVRLAKEHTLSFAVNPTLYQNTISFDGIVVADPDDPMISGRERMTETYLNTGFSMLYNWKDLNFSIAFPILFNNRSLFNNDDYQNLLTMDRNWLIYAGYKLRLPAEFALRFDVLYRQTQHSPWTLDVAASAIFRDAFRLGFLYRKGNIFGVSAGITMVKSIQFNYTYEFGANAMMGSNGGNHEVSLGYFLQGKAAAKAGAKDPQLMDYNK